MRRIFLQAAFALLAFAAMGQQFPFPMNQSGYLYQYGIVASEPDNEQIQTRFEAWDKTMYRESDDGQFGRIRFDNAKFTVSEGIGYGMLIYVYMANATNDLCQDRFDKLYAYYQKWSNGNGLMHWKIEGFDQINSYNAATDADLDVALALCLAAKQWGYSPKYVYADEAETILKAIYEKEVGVHDVNGVDLTVFNPGDSWNSIANPCYFTVASVGVFDQTQDYFNFPKKNDWKKVYDDCHTYLEASQRNGLWPNWSNWDGTPSVRAYDESSPDFGWDACRTPWRIAWDYVWFGSASSKAMMAKTVGMLEARELLENPGKTGYFSNLAGESYADLVAGSPRGISAFVGGFASALMCDEFQQENLDIYHEYLKKYPDSPYYSQTLQVLYLLLTSGNAANFFDLDGCAPQKVVNPVIASAATDGETLTIRTTKLLDETADFSGFALYVDGELQTEPFSSIDVSGTDITLGLQGVTISQGSNIAVSYQGEGVKSVQGGVLGASVKFPVTNRVFVVGGSTVLADCENGKYTLLGGDWYSYSDGSTQKYEMLPDGADGTETAVRFTFEDVKSFVGVGFNILPSENPLDCSGSTGVSFYHKGDECILEAKTVTKKNLNYSYQTLTIEAHEEWTLVELEWETIADDFVSSGYVTEVTGLQWKETSGSGEFWIDEVVLLGRSISPAVKDREALKAALVSANRLYSNASTEFYPQSAIDNLAEAINSAADVILAETSSRDDFDAATAALNDAISAYKYAAYGDKKILAKTIKSANEVIATAVVGAENGNYPQSAVDALNEAIAEALSAYDTFGLNSAEVAEAVKNLNTAMKAFKASVVVVSAIESVAIQLAIFPNPCADVLNIESPCEIQSVVLVGIDGSRNVFEGRKTAVSLQVSHLPSGIYLAEVRFADGSVAMKKIVKE